jgi:SAM-dependent methyltransferase
MTAFTNPDAYERWMGRWSARVAPDFVRFAAPGPLSRCLDVGAGTGVLTEALLAASEEARVVGIEPAASYVEFARARVADDRARFEVGDAQAIPFEDDNFDAALAMLVLQQVPDAPKAVAEMCRVTVAGGCVAACQWDFRNGMPMISLFWDAVRAVVPAGMLGNQAARRNPPAYSDEAALVRLWTEAGIGDIETARFDASLQFASFEDYWQPFLGGATPTSSFAATLPEENRQAVEARLREMVPDNGPDHPFTLKARAWAVRGTVP